MLQLCLSEDMEPIVGDQVSSCDLNSGSSSNPGALTCLLSFPHCAVPSDWEKAKGQAECLDYLLEIAVKMKLAGMDTEGL